MKHDIRNYTYMIHGSSLIFGTIIYLQNELYIVTYIVFNTGLINANNRTLANFRIIIEQMITTFENKSAIL